MYAPPLTPEASQTRTDLMSSKFRAGQRHIRWCGVQVAPESLTGVIRPGCVMLGLEMRFHSLVDMTTACKALLSHCHWNTTLLDSTASDIDMSIDGSMYGVRAAPPPPPPPRGPAKCNKKPLLPEGTSQKIGRCSCGSVAKIQLPTLHACVEFTTALLMAWIHAQHRSPGHGCGCSLHAVCPAENHISRHA